VSALRERDAEAASWFDTTLGMASLRLTGAWPEGIPAPAPGSQLRARFPGLNVTRKRGT